MKKMDEIMELFTEEIDGFNRSIGKLKAMSEKLDNLKIMADSSKVEYLIKEHLNQVERTMYGNRLRVEEILKGVQNAKLTPKWLLGLLCIASTITVFTLGYFGYHFIELEDSKKEAFVEGKREIISQLRGYFDENPKEYENFKKWSEEKNTVPNQK